MYDFLGKQGLIQTIRAGMLACLISLIGSATPVAALTFDLGTVFSGSDPAGTAPYLRVTIEDTAANTVLLTMETSGLTDPAQFVSGWYFNVNDVSGLQFTYQSGQAAQSITTGSDCCKADGDGYFDILFSFATANGPNRFTPGESSVYNIMAAGLDENDFNLVSAPGGGTGNYFTAAHIQGIPPNCSSWVGAPGTIGNGGSDGPCDPTQLPEPSSLVLLGVGIIALGAMARKFTNKE